MTNRNIWNSTQHSRTSLEQVVDGSFGVFKFIQRDRMKQLIPNSCGEINHIPHTFETFERQSNHDGRLFSTPGENTLQPQDPVEHPEPSPPHVRHQVRWETANGIIEFSALDGETLRTAALRRGVVSPHNGRAQLINCRGLGTCGTCAVELKSGSVHPAERNTKERLRLSFPPHGGDNQPPSLRLACQVQVQSDIEVIKRSGFWGQRYDALSTSEECKTYLGDWEYILDSRSPFEGKDADSGGGASS